LAKRLESATCIGKERGSVTTTRRLKAVYRRAVALAGDASGSIDAITGDGLNLSFRQATALASAMHKGDLSIYERAHQKLSRRPMYMARLLLLLDSNSLLRERTIRTLAAYPDIFSRLLRLHVGAPTSMEIASASALLGWRLVTA
jgi:flavin-dependent dehydrogenase